MKPMSMNPKLTPVQKRVAKLMVMGWSTQQIRKVLHVTTDQLWYWRHRHPAFDRYLRRLNREFDAEIDRRQKALLDKAFKALERLLKSSNPKSVQFAVSTVLKLNRRYPEHAVTLTHEGTVTHQVRRLTPEEKQRIKELLDATRELGSQN